MESRKDIKFCSCGLVLENGLCKRHKDSQPKPKTKIPRLRGKSIWAEKEGLFTGLEE